MCALVSGVQTWSRPIWAALDPARRADRLSRWADAIEADAYAIGEALAVDTGRRFLAHREVAGAVSNIRRWARMAPEKLATAAMQPSQLVDGLRYGNQLVPYALCGFLSTRTFPVTLSLIEARKIGVEGKIVSVRVRFAG